MKAVARTRTPGSGELQLLTADEEDEVVICRVEAEQLGSYAAILAHFDAADRVVPPLRLIG